jgi:hypothetical protein
LIFAIVLYLAPDAFPFSVTELRLLTILQQIPFVIPFDTRVQVLNLLIQQNKSEQQQGADFLQNGSTINIRVRRDYVYEDAFEKLSPENGKEKFFILHFSFNFSL